MPHTPPQIRLVDDLCHEFEQAWKNGDASLEEYLQQAPSDCRELLLKELAAIELHYRIDPDGKRSPCELLDAAHPELASELAQCLATDVLLPGKTQKSAAVSQSDVRLVSEREAHGLRIRCPHCRSAVELLVDSPYEEMKCDSCGGDFSVAGDESAGRATSVLPTVGRFELIRRLGVGGFGTVWEARDPELDRVVALKIPRRGQLRPNEIEYFFREARAAAQLKHPQIVAVHELGRDDETVFIVSDYVEGEPLSKWMADRTLSYSEIAKLCVMIAEALHHAHEHGVVHRDLKPSNVMIDGDGKPQIMDFGLAKRDVGEVTMTAAGQILGTAAFMSPEQAGGQSHWTDRRTDIYSLGVMLFQLATSELPFRGNLESQLVSKQLNEAPDPRTLDNHIPRDFSTICLKCLERDPNARYGTAQLVADELNRFLHGEPIRARPISRFKKSWRWTKRRPWTAAAIGLASFLAVAGPITASVINEQLHRIADQRDELMDQIGDAEVEKQSLRAREQSALARIDKLKGRVPGIEKDAPSWKLELIRMIVDQRYAADSGAERALFPSKLEEAQYHSALGFLFAQLESKSQALAHLKSAKSLLQTLREQNPENEQYEFALAECVEAITDQYGYTPEAEASIEELVAIRIEATNSEDASLVRVFDLLEARYKGGNPEKHLNETVPLKQKIVSSWPTAPQEIYDLACHLTFRPAVLSSASENDAQFEP